MDDHSDKNTIDDTKHKINTKHNTKFNNVCSDVKHSGNSCVAVFVVSLCFAVVTRLRLVPSHGHHHVACMS